MAKKKRIFYTNRPWEATGICSGCHSCELWCSLKHDESFNPYRSRIRVEEVAPGIDVPVTCQQCQDPACKAACRFDAFVLNKELHIVTVDPEKCTGCGSCLGACPYGIISLDPITQKAIKCDLCGGKDPECVTICPSHVLAMLDDTEAATYRRRRYAALLATDDELRRSRPAGEEPFSKNFGT